MATNIYQKELRTLCRIWGLPACTGEHRGHVRILIGLSALDPQKVPRPIPWQKGVERAYHEEPVYMRDPIGAVLAQYPLKNTDFFEAWRESDFFDAISARHYFRETFLLLGRAQLEISLEIVHHKANKLEALLDPNQSTSGKLVRDGLQGLFREKRRLLKAEGIRLPLYGTHEDQIREMRKQARLAMRLLLKGKTEPFKHALEAITIQLRGSRTALDALGSKRAGPPLEPSSRTTVSEDIEECQYSRKSVRTLRPEGEWPNWLYRCHTANYPIGQPRAGMPCRIEVRQLIRAANALKDAADTVIETCLCGLVVPRLLPYLEFEPICQFWSVLRFSSAHLHGGPPPEAKHLYHDCGTIVQRYIPRRIELAFRTIQRDLRKEVIYRQIVGEAAIRAKKYVPTTTFARCLAALRIHGNSWFNVDFVLVDWGLRPQYAEGRSSVHAARSYTYLSSLNMASSHQLCMNFDPTLPEPGTVHLRGWGARFCPTTKVLRQIVQRFNDILSDGCADREDGILRWNAAMAVAHLLAVLLSGLRNYPFETVKPLTVPLGCVEPVHQKGPVIAFTSPPVVQELLVRLEGFQDRLKSFWRQDGVPGPFRRFEREPYCFIDIASARSGEAWRLLPVCHRSVTEGLRNDRILKNIAEIGVNSMRDYSNTELRRCGKFKEVDIRSFHYHYELGVQPFLRHRFEPPGRTQVMDNMVKHLADRIGL